MDAVDELQKQLREGLNLTSRIVNEAAMASRGDPSKFDQLRRLGHVVVEDPPKFDLDAYIANYKGRTRFDRLLLIGLSSTYLYLDALKAAVREAKSGEDVQQYETALVALQDMAFREPDAKSDVEWMEKTKKRNTLETSKLEGELKGYKNNLIKESIRMGYDDLGQHYHRIGDLSDASKAYSKMRDFCTTNTHIIIMSMHLIQVSIDQQNWLAVQSNVQRIRQSLDNNKFPEAEKNTAKLSAAMGVSHLAMGHYRDAAREFLETDPRMTGAKLDVSDDEEAYNEVLTPNDIAVYGGLCALASMSREELQQKVLAHKTFRNYLELEPHIRRAISYFVSSKYSACLSILDSYKADYLLDIYLQKHLEDIYFRIRSKAIHQYFIPFSCVTLSALATAFNTDEASIQVELIQMIKQGKLDARIDLVDRVLLARKVDGRNQVHADALAAAQDYERTVHLRMLRMAVLNAGLEVKAPNKQQQSQQQGAEGLASQQGLFNGVGRGDLIMGDDR